MKRASKRPHVTGLAAIRHQHGYTQYELAQLLGITRTRLSMVECGQRSLPAQALFKILDLELKRVESERLELERVENEADSIQYEEDSAKEG